MAKFVSKDEYKRALVDRQVAYANCFVKDSRFTQTVLEDLMEFCRAKKSTFHPDPHVQAALEGRREVWLRIQDHLNLSHEDLYNLHVKKEIKPTEKDE